MDVLDRWSQLILKAERAYRGLRMAGGRAGKVRRWLRTASRDGWSQDMEVLADETLARLDGSLGYLKSAEGFLSTFLVRAKCRNIAKVNKEQDNEH